MAEDSVWISATEQGCGAPKYDGSMPRPDFDQLDAARGRANPNVSAIVVCHRCELGLKCGN